MKTEDFITLIHPVLAVILVFPLLGIALNYAWQTRQRRLQAAAGNKSQIPLVVGREHVAIGKWLAGSVVGVTLIALAYAITFGYKGLLDKAKEGNLPAFQVIFIVLMFILTVASFVLLYRAKLPHWRGIFATLSGMGVVVLGCQDGVYRLSQEWYWSHYYLGVAATMLMILSVATIDDIYRDRSHRWRTAHTVLNCVATLLFLGQGMTGTRDLLQIPLGWQKPTIYKCDFQNLTCPGANLPDSNASAIASAPELER